MANLFLDWNTPLTQQQGDDPPHSGWIRWHSSFAHMPRLVESVDDPEPTDSLAIHQLAAMISSRLEQALRFKLLEDQVAALSAKMDRLEGQVKTVFIQTFAPEPYEVLRPLAVVIEPSGSEFAASFFDANISTSGDTEQEAFENLKNLVLDIFDSLSREEPGRLGPEPSRQLAVLRSFIRGR